MWVCGVPGYPLGNSWMGIPVLCRIKNFEYKRQDRRSLREKQEKARKEPAPTLEQEGCGKVRYEQP